MEILTLEDRLSSITADLISFREHELFLERLFSNKAGKILHLENLCNGLTDIENQFQELKKIFKGTVLVTWLDYPNSPSGLYNCIIIFFVEELIWKNVAFFYRF